MQCSFKGSLGMQQTACYFRLQPVHNGRRDLLWVSIPLAVSPFKTACSSRWSQAERTMDHARAASRLRHPLIKAVLIGVISEETVPGTLVHVEGEWGESHWMHL
eukprot:5205759-Amphidinium_carterae.1